MDTIDERPVTTGETPTQIQKILGNASLPEQGTSVSELFSKSSDLLLNHSLLNGHPKFLGYITSSPAPIGVLADLLAATVNPNVGANILSPMATAIEKQTVKWLAEFIGVSPTYGGILVSGGNMANFTAFLAGCVLFRLIIGIALTLGINPNWLKFVTAFIVLLVVGLPNLKRKSS